MRLSGRALTRVLVGLVLAIVVLSGVAVATIEWRWTRRFDAPYPSIDASRDLRAIYLFLRSLPPTVKQTGAVVQAKSKSE